MKTRIKTALRDQGYILTIGVDPAMSTGCGIAVIRYWPETHKTQPIITRTLKPFNVAEVVGYLREMKWILRPDVIHAIGTETSYRGKYASVPYALGRCRGLVEGIASVLWPGILTEGFKAKEWRLAAFGSGSVTKQQALLTAQADFNNPEWDAQVIGAWTEDAAEAYHIARATAHKLTEG